MTNGLTNVAPNVSRTTAHVQNNHHKYMTETKLALQKHTTTVHALRQEREDLLRELGSAGLGTTMNLMDTAKSASSHSGSGSPNNTIDLRRKATQHREEIRLLKIKLDAEQKRTQELEKNIAVLQGEQFATRAVMGGVNVRKENYQLFEKQMKVLENRLDQSLVRFNDTIAHNKQLRETIDTLRREREVFNEIYAKLERELQDKKFHMSDTIEVSNRCYETRDGYVAELERLRITAQDELTSFNHKLRDLDAEAALILSKEAAMEEEKEQAVARIKAQRVAAAAAAAATVSLGTLPAVNKSLAGSAPSDPTNNTSGNGNNVNLGATEALPAVDPQVAIRHYQEMLEQLREATGVQDMKKLQEKFRSVEESNFSMYNYIHSLNKEIEGIEDEIESLRESMDGDKGDPATRRALQELEEELAQTEGIQHAYQEKNRAIRNELHVLVSILRDVMSNTGAIAAMTTASDPTNESEPSTTPIPNEITERNMGVFLAALERHAMAYVQRQQLANHRSRLAEKEATAATTATVAGTAPDDSDSITARRRSQYEEEGRAPPRLGTSSGNVHQLMTSHGLPSTGDGFGNDGEDGDDDRVLSEKELRERIERRFLAKEMNGGDRAERKKGKGAGIKR